MSLAPESIEQLVGRLCDAFAMVERQDFRVDGVWADPSTMEEILRVDTRPGLWGATLHVSERVTPMHVILEWAGGPPMEWALCGGTCRTCMVHEVMGL